MHSMGSPEVCCLCFIPMWQCWHLLISMSENDEINFYPPWVGVLVGKGLNKGLQQTVRHQTLLYTQGHWHWSGCEISLWFFLHQKVFNTLFRVIVFCVIMDAVVLVACIFMCITVSASSWSFSFLKKENNHKLIPPCDINV